MARRGSTFNGGDDDNARVAGGIGGLVSATAAAAVVEGRASAEVATELEVGAAVNPAAETGSVIELLTKAYEHYKQLRHSHDLLPGSTGALARPAAPRRTEPSGVLRPPWRAVRRTEPFTQTADRWRRSTCMPETTKWRNASSRGSFSRIEGGWWLVLASVQRSLLTCAIHLGQVLVANGKRPGHVCVWGGGGCCTHRSA